MDFFVGILGGVIVRTIVHVSSQPQQGGAKRTRSGREYGRPSKKRNIACG